MVSFVNDSSSALEASESTSSFDSACRLEEDVTSNTSLYSVSPSEECGSGVILLKLDNQSNTTTNNSQLILKWLEMFKVFFFIFYKILENTKINTTKCFRAIS